MTWQGQMTRWGAELAATHPPACTPASVAVAYTTAPTTGESKRRPVVLVDTIEHPELGPSWLALSLTSRPTYKRTGDPRPRLTGPELGLRYPNGGYIAVPRLRPVPDFDVEFPIGWVSLDDARLIVAHCGPDWFPPDRVERFTRKARP